MKTHQVFFIIALLLISIAGSTHFLSQKKDENLDKRVFVALRNSGHQLLLQYSDSTSLVSPIERSETASYKLSFQTELTIKPDSLESSIRRNFEKAKLENDFIVEVIKCNSTEVSYSYIQTMYFENTIVPCTGRELPADCYEIVVTFQSGDKPFKLLKLISFYGFLLFVLVGVILFIRNRARAIKLSKESREYTTVGSYKFYENQNKLVREEHVIELTSKECEIMVLLSQHPNEIVKRETLIKEVWENKGVVVGRSLDTYISKIRKKLNDDSIKIVNIHGVGYKLEIK